MTGCPSCEEWARRTIPTMTGGQRIERECPDCRTVLILLDERTHRTQEVKA